MNNNYIIAALTILLCTGCKKDEDNSTPVDQTQLEKNILIDFAVAVVNPTYADINLYAESLRTSINVLVSVPSDTNLEIAKSDWRNVREPWEKSEAYLFGPVEDNNYDPEMDTWPINVVDIQGLLASNNPLTTSDIDLLATSMKGFHAIEYVLFGESGVKTASELTSRELTYLSSLAENLYNTTTNLKNSWTTGGFTELWKTAGEGSTRFPMRRDAFMTMVSALAGICEEVGEGKMHEPFIMQDSTLEESQFSHNSIEDFRNNMRGVRDVYYGKYSVDGHGLEELVNIRNTSLNQKIKTQISNVLSGFDQINPDYGMAIYTQPNQIMQQQAAINSLKESLENELLPSLQQWISQ